MDEEIKALKSELALLKLQFSERVFVVENRLNKLSEQHNPSSPSSPVSDSIEPLPKQSVSVVNTTDHDTVIKVTASKVTASKVIASKVTAPKDIDLKDTSPKNSGLMITSANKIKPPKPSAILIFLQALLQSLFNWFSPVTKLVQSYKARGMLGIFALTLVGIGLTLAGFGYLMQLLIDQLGAGYKALLMTLAAASVMGLGIGLKIKTRFDEFATAIVTLGVLLCYSTIYFSGSVYGIIPDIAILVLYLFIALMCHYLAVLLNTKVVASLGIIGVAAMPIISNTLQTDTVYYLLSLAFINASSLILAYRNKWHWLANLCLAFSFIAIEWVMESTSLLVSSWVINLFYALFFCFVIRSLHQERFASKNTLILLAASVGSTVMIFFQITTTLSYETSLIFSINAVAASAAALLFFKIKHPLTHFLVLLTALWMLLATISALSEAYWPMAWAVEGLLLVYIGRNHLMSAVITQGQILLFLSLAYMLSVISVQLPVPALTSVDGWVFCSVILAVIACWQRLINESVVFNYSTRHKIKPTLQFVEFVWLTVLVGASAFIWLGVWAGALVILWQIAILFRARQCQNTGLEIFSASLIIVPLFYVVHSAMTIGSIRLSLLPIDAKLALFSAFMQLWLWSAFYRKFQPDSKLKKAAEVTRLLFYMAIPLFWLGTAVRRLEEDFLIIAWLSPLLALLLALKIKHQWLSFETKILTALASLIFVSLIGTLNLGYSLAALGGFVSFYVLAFWVARKHADNTLVPFICRCGILSIGMALPTIVVVQTDNLFYGAITASLFWVLSLNVTNISRQFKNSEILISLFNLLLIVAAWIKTLSVAYFAVIPTIFLVALLYKKETRFATSWLGNVIGANRDLFLHTVAAITYCTLMLALTTFRIDLLIAPALAIHGALILFISYKHIISVKFGFSLIMFGIIKLALLDTANALLWQKVILFMGIGVLILAASFWYQKLMNKSADSVVQTPTN